MSKGRILALMARAPVPGEVKMRLCPPLDPPEAARLYRCFTLDTLSTLKTIDADLAVCYWPDSANALFRQFAPGAFGYLPQMGEDYGERLISCVSRLCKDGPPLVLVRPDCPTLPVREIERAYRMLESGEAEVVLGPSIDGGYYLVGLNSPHSPLFHRMPWGKPRLLEMTLDKAKELGLKTALASEWYTVRTLCDLESLVLDLEPGKEQVATQAPRTRAFLHELITTGVLACSIAPERTLTLPSFEPGPASPWSPPKTPVPV